MVSLHMKLEQILKNYNQEPIGLRRCRLSHWKNSVKKFLNNKKKYNVKISLKLKNKIIWMFKNKVVLKTISKQLSVSAETVRKVVSNSILNNELDTKYLQESLSFEISLLTDYEKEMLKSYGVIYMIINRKNGMFDISKTTKKGNEYKKYFGGSRSIKKEVADCKRKGFLPEQVFCKHILCSCTDNLELNERKNFL